MRRRLVNKIMEVCGESLIETLASLVIICLGMVMLPGAVVAAARVSRAVEDQVTAVSDNSVTIGATDVTVSIGGSAISSNSVMIVQSGTGDSALYKY